MSASAAALPGEALDTWTSVRAWLEARFALARDEATWAGILVGEHRAWVKVVLGADGVIAVLAPACSTKELGDVDPARLVGQPLVTPTLVAEAGLYLVRERQDLGRLTTSSLERMIAFVSAQAAAIGREIGRTQGTLDCFHNYSE